MALSDALIGMAPNGTSRYVALFTTMPDESGAGAVEVSGGGYARKAHSAWLAKTTDGVAYRINNGTIEFAELTTAVEGVVGFGLYDALSSGSLLAWGAFDDGFERDLRKGETPKIQDRFLKIRFPADVALKTSAHSESQANPWQSVAYSPSLGLWVAVADSGSNRVMTSPDGKTWTNRTAPANTWKSVCWSAALGMFVAVGGLGTSGVMTSTNGTTWTTRTTPNGEWKSVAWSPTLARFVAVGLAGGVNYQMTSTNGTTWTVSGVTQKGGYWSSVCWAPDIAKFVTVGLVDAGEGFVLTSTDGLTWVNQTAAAGNQWTSVAWSPDLDLLAAVSIDGANRVMTSPDGVTWTSRSAAEANEWRSVCWSDLGMFLAVSSDGTNRIMLSEDGITWTAMAASEATTWMGVAWANEQALFVAVADGGTDQVMNIRPSAHIVEAEIDITDEFSLAKLQSLLPPGIAWPRDADAELTKLMRALAYEFSRVSRRVFDLAEELDPRTTQELLDEYERVYGLPDECVSPTTIAERQAALHGKMLGHADPSRPNIIDLAAGLGYTISIETWTHDDVFTCVSDCTDSLYTHDWLFCWHVTTPSGDADAVLECVLESIAPLHTTLHVEFT